MAGEWLKFDCSLPEKPEVLAITVALDWDDPDLTVGKLMRLFRWFDQHTVSGNAASVTPALLDRIIGVTGFVDAVAAVGWIVVEGGGLSLHNFERHNGATAKSRAQTAKRVANHKANATGNAEGNAPSVSAALPREEKRREEIPPTNVGGGGKRPARKCPEEFTVTEAMETWAKAEAPLVNIDTATAAFRDHTFKTAMTDWPGAWRNWLRKDQGYAVERANRPTYAQQAADIARTTVPAKPGKDAALLAIEADRKAAAPVPQATREFLAKLKPTGATQ